MGTNNLDDHAPGDVIEAADPNSIHDALKVELIGRNSSGVPTAGQPLGTTGIPWGDCRVTQLFIGGKLFTPVKEFAFLVMSVDQTTGLTTGSPIKFDTILNQASGSNITLNAGTYRFTLPKGKVYRIEAKGRAEGTSLGVTFYRVTATADFIGRGGYFVTAANIDTEAWAIVDLGAEATDVEYELRISGATSVTSVSSDIAALMITEL